MRNRNRHILHIAVSVIMLLIMNSSGQRVWAEEPQFPQEAKIIVPTLPGAPLQETRKSAPFGVGERLKFSVGWGALRAGTATVEIEDIVDFQGYKVYQVVAKAKSSGVFSAIYLVRDRIESLIDVNGLFSRRYWMQMDEANEKRDRQFIFDQENNLVKYNDKTYYIRYGIHDEISAVYYARTLDLHVGNPVYINIFSKRQNWQVKVNVLKTERITVPAGEFDTIVIEPELQFDGIMKKGKVKVWLTNDQWRIPVQVRSKIAIGSITIQLEEYELGKQLAYNK